METFEDLWEEEEEDLQEESDSPSEIPPPKPATITPEQQEQVEKLLDELQIGKQLTDNIEEVVSDISLNLLNYQDFPALQWAHTKLTIKGKDPKIKVVFWACIMAMAGAINLYLDPELSYTWWEGSLLVENPRVMAVIELTELGHGFTNISPLESSPFISLATATLPSLKIRT